MKKSIISTIFVFVIVLMTVACGSTPATNSENIETSKIEEENNNSQKTSEVKSQEISKVEKIKAALDKAPQWVLDNGVSANTSETVCEVGIYHNAKNKFVDIVTGNLNVENAIEEKLKKDLDIKNPKIVLVDYLTRDLWYFQFTDTIFLLGCADREKSKEESIRKTFEGAPQWVLDNGASETNSKQICAVGNAGSKLELDFNIGREITKKIKAELGLPEDNGTSSLSPSNNCYGYKDRYVELSDICFLVKDNWKTNSGIFYALSCADRDKIKSEIKKTSETTKTTKSRERVNIEEQQEEDYDIRAEFNTAPQWIKDGGANIDTAEQICEIDLIREKKYSRYRRFGRLQSDVNKSLLIKIGKEFGFFTKNDTHFSSTSISTVNDQIVIEHNGERLSLPSSAYVYENKDSWRFKAAGIVANLGCVDRKKIKEALEKTSEEKSEPEKTEEK